MTGAASDGSSALDARQIIVSSGSWWRAWVLPLLLAAVALVLTTPRLGVPGEYVLDELYHAYTAAKYVAGDNDSYQCCKPPRDKPAIEWTHPPLAKLLISGGVLAFGDNPIGWRAMSAIFGAAGVAITYLLAKTLTGNPGIATIASILLLLDGLYFVESRTGMSSLFLLVFTNAALLVFAFVLTRPTRPFVLPLLATSTFLGLAISTKWSAIALLGLIALTFVWHAICLWRDSKTGLMTSLGWAAAALVLLPATIYLASYGHFFVTGHGWSDFVQLHRDMLAYHRDIGVMHPFASSWWEWPLTARPVWYFADGDARTGQFIFANGNPLLYWPMVVAVGWVAIDWWDRRTAAGRRQPPWPTPSRSSPSSSISFRSTRPCRSRPPSSRPGCGSGVGANATGR